MTAPNDDEKSPAQIHDLEKARDRVFEIAHHFFPPETLAGARVDGYLRSMCEISERRTMRAIRFGWVLGVFTCALALAFPQLLQYIGTGIRWVEGLFS